MFDKFSEPTGLVYYPVISLPWAVRNETDMGNDSRHLPFQNPFFVLKSI